jgi:hypothetical protein
MQKLPGKDQINAEHFPLNSIKNIEYNFLIIITESFGMLIGGKFWLLIDNDSLYLDSQRERRRQSFQSYARNRI